MSFEGGFTDGGLVCIVEVGVGVVVGVGIRVGVGFRVGVGVGVGVGGSSVGFGVGSSVGIGVGVGSNWGCSSSYHSVQIRKCIIKVSYSPEQKGDD